jgi:hypothetical protein
MQMAKNAVLHFAAQSHTPTHLLIAHDAKDVQEFAAVLAAAGIAVKRLCPLAPNQNAYCRPSWAGNQPHPCWRRAVDRGAAAVPNGLGEPSILVAA